VLHFYTFAGLLIITLGILGFSTKSLFFEGHSKVTDGCSNNSTGVDNLSVTPEILVPPVVVDTSQIPVISVVSVTPEILVPPVVVGTSQIPVIPAISEFSKELSTQDMFKFVRYELNYINTSKYPVKMLVNFVSEDRLQVILKKIKTCQKIILRYNSQYSRPGEDLFEDCFNIYNRFQYHKEEVSSFSHGNKYDDWIHASSMLDDHRQTVTLLMLALLDKPNEWVDVNVEAPWNYEVWQRYMFECPKNFAGAFDVLNYAEELIQGYLVHPELYSKIEPVLHVVENAPTLKVIYLWDKMVEAARAKKALNTVPQSIDLCLPTTEHSNPIVEVLNQQSVVIEHKLMEDSVQSSFSDKFYSLVTNLKDYLISFFF
jgi:hypothetical protein